MRNLLIKIIFFVVSLMFISPVLAGENIKLSKGQTVYVPAYSHIYGGDKEIEFLLAVTLSIRNTDPKNSFIVTTVDYYDSAGKLIKKYLEKPLKLAALASTRYVIKESDKTGGSGANFIVSWESDKMIHPPIIESVMIGTRGQQGISFVSRGQVLQEAKE